MAHPLGANALFVELRRLNGADIANAIETSDIRLRNEGLADGTVRCLTPALPPAVGHAVTVRIRTSSPPPTGDRYRDRTDWWNYILQVPPPRFVIAQDIDARSGLGAFLGGVHASVLRALGAVAFATNGAVRDVPAVARLGFHLFASCTSVSHAFAHIVDFGTDVTIGGLGVSSGDLLFGDAHGLQSIPPAIVERLPEMVARSVERDDTIVRFCES